MAKRLSIKESYQKYKDEYGKAEKLAKSEGYGMYDAMYTFEQYELIYEAIKRDFPESKKNPIRAIVNRQRYRYSSKQAYDIAIETFKKGGDALTKNKIRMLRYDENITTKEFFDDIKETYRILRSEGLDREGASEKIHDLYFPDSE